MVAGCNNAGILVASLKKFGIHINNPLPGGAIASGYAEESFSLHETIGSATLNFRCALAGVVYFYICFLVWPILPKLIVDARALHFVVPTH